MTQLEILKAAFERGESLTVADALSKYQVYALSQRCGDLRKRGLALQSWWQKLPDGGKVKRYGLTLPMIEDIKRTSTKMIAHLMAGEIGAPNVLLNHLKKLP